MLVCISTIGQAKSSDTAAINKLIRTPVDYNRMAEALGDLDKDGVAELVVVYNTPKEVEMGTERKLYIYKQNNGKWTLWHKNKTAVLSSRHGGMMGDAFEGIDIRNGCIVIYHMGGSRDKWAYTHTYRYQRDNWFLIGATITYFAPCTLSQTFDYNLSTGRINLESSADSCNDDGDNIKTTDASKKTFTKKVVPVLMDSFTPGDNMMKLPGTKDEFYY